MNDLENINWERRARASERTAELLKRKVVDLHDRGSQSVLSRQLTRAKQREEANQRRRALMEVRQQELARNAELLEGQVAQRTRAIRTILDNVAFGFLLVGRELEVLPGFTRSCSDLFGREPSAGTLLSELVDADERMECGIALLVDQVFEDLLPEEVSLDQLPSRFPVRGRILSVEASVVRDEHGDVESLLLSVSDITALEEAQRDAQRNRTLVSILGQRAAFSRFVVDTRELLEEAEALSDQTVVRRLVHTVKGNAASWGLSDVAATAHRVEDEDIITPAHVKLLHAEMERFLRESGDVVGLTYEPTLDPTCSVARSKVRELHHLVDSVRDQDHGAQLRRWATTISQCPASELIGPMDMFVDGLAERLDKSIHLELEGMSTSVDPDIMAPVFRNLTHLVRNAVDHGIEHSADRGGKPSQGKLRIAVSSLADAYTVTVADDGRGIDIGRIVQKALAMNVVDPSELATMSRSDQLELIFHDGLSSAERTTETSGRGVGMAAMRRAARAGRGSISVSSTPNEGTQIVVRVPKPLELRQAG